MSESCKKNSAKAQQVSTNPESAATAKRPTICTPIERLGVQPASAVSNVGPTTLNRSAYEHLGGQLMRLLAEVRNGSGDAATLECLAREALGELQLIVDACDEACQDLTVALGMFRSRLSPMFDQQGIALRWRTDRLPAGLLLDADHILRIFQTLRDVLQVALAKPSVAVVQVMAHGESIRGYAEICVRALDGCGRPISIQSSSGGAAVAFKVDDQELFKIPVNVSLH